MSDRKNQPVDVLFVSERPLWPLNDDFRAIGCRVARELTGRGLRVAMASMEPTVKPQAWLAEMLVAWPESGRVEVEGLLSGWRGALKDLRHVLAEREGSRVSRLAGVIGLVHRYQPAVVIGLGDRAPALLRGIKGAAPAVQTVWLAHHDPTLRHLSILRDTGRTECRWTLGNTLNALMHELTFGDIDAVIGGSKLDARASRLLTRARQAVILRRGINLERYSPAEEPIRPQTAITWARLDDEDAARALLRFGLQVWPKLHEHFPGAQWRLMGPNPHKLLRPLTKLDGVKVYPALPDLRQRARRTRVALLPFRCAAHGHKAMLEAAGLGMAIATTPAVARHAGLPGRGGNAVATASREQDWVKLIARLWTDPIHAKALASNARQWAVENADWRANTAELLRLIDQRITHNRAAAEKQSQAIHKSVESHPAQQPIADKTRKPATRRSGYRQAA